MTKHARQRFLVLVKVALLGVSFPLAVTSPSWVQAGTRQNNSLEYAQAPAKSTPQPSQSATPQPNKSADAKKTSQPNEEKKQEESEKSDKDKKPKPSLIVIAVGFAVVLVLYLGVLRFRPLWLLWLPAELKVPKIGIIPEFKVPVPISRFLKYRPRVLDAWVNQHLDTFREKFLENETVIERKNYVPVPVRLGTREVKELTAEALSETFKKDKRVRLLIWGEGGSGKTTLACQMAKWAMEKKGKSQRLTEHLILPILVEQDLDSIAGDGMKPLMEALVGTLQELIDSEQTIVDELLVEQLLRQRRILLIVDHFSEMSKATRDKIPLSLRDFPANALVVTSRLEEKVPGIDTKIQTVRFDGEELVSFIKNYLQKCGKWGLFEEDQEQFLQECSQLVRIVGDKKTITVLLAKLYAQRMINSKEHASESVRSLDNIPDLILDHLEKLNRDVERKTGEEYHTLKEDAKILAWKCLEQNYKPSYVQCGAVVDVWGEKKAEKSLEYFEKQLHLINSGNKGDTIRFALDPLAEYLAGLYLVEDGCNNNEESWRDFLQKLEGKSDNREDIKGFLLAVRDCCLAKGANAKVRGFVADEVGKLAGLDMDALKQEQLKRRIQRRISELFVPEVQDRQRAIQHMGEIAAEEVGNFGLTVKLGVPALLKVVSNDENASVRFIATEALSKLGNTSDKVLQTLLTLLENNQVNYQVRSSAAQTLIKLGYVSQSVQQTLLALLEDNQVDDWVRSKAAEALGNLGNVSEPVEQMLLALLEDNQVNYRVRSSVARALGNLGNASEPVQQGLLALLTDENEYAQVCSSVARALGNLGNASEPVQQA
jgi:HEAT repeat protein